MLIYRIGKTRHARDLSGEGARLNGGRWNHPGTPCIYTAETRALSLLEYTAHVSIDDIPRALSFTCIEIPDDAIETVALSKLPGNWASWPHPKASRDFGDALLLSAGSLILKLPSAIVPDEFNYVIDPLHSRIKEVTIVSAKDYAYDIRLKK